MKIILDPDGDAAYFYLREGISEVKTIWITEDLSIDLVPMRSWWGWRCSPPPGTWD